MILSELTFLTDENISPTVVAFLRAKGADVLDVKEARLDGSSDRKLLALAFVESRVVLTHDMDFGQIVHTEKVDFTGIIYLKPGHVPPFHSVEAIRRLFESPQILQYPFLITCVCFPAFRVRLKFF